MWAGLVIKSVLSVGDDRLPCQQWIKTVYYREALVYFFLACVGGVLVFCSCIVGQYVSHHLAPHHHRHLASHHHHHHHQLQRTSRDNSEVISKERRRQASQESDTPYPWVFFDPNINKRIPCIYSQEVYQGYKNNSLV